MTVHDLELAASETVRVMRTLSVAAERQGAAETLAKSLSILGAVDGEGASQGGASSLTLATWRLSGYVAELIFRKGLTLAGFALTKEGRARGGEAEAHPQLHAYRAVVAWHDTTADPAYVMQLIRSAAAERGGGEQGDVFLLLIISALATMADEVPKMSANMADCSPAEFRRAMNADG